MAYEDLANNFHNGDVIYGLDVPRAQALRTLKTHNVERTQPITTVYCCGLFSSTKVKRNIVIQNDLTNAVWDPSSPNKYSSRKKIKSELADAKKGVTFKSFLKTHVNYNVKSRHDPETDSMKKAKNAWQRTSKAGLEFSVRNKGTVHFIITDLQIDSVASKKGHGESITSGELRWLYRHKNVQDVIDHVKFYNADGEVSHDEVFNNSSWDAYQPSQTYGSNWEIHRISNMIDIVKR